MAGYPTISAERQVVQVIEHAQLGCFVQLRNVRVVLSQRGVRHASRQLWPRRPLEVAFTVISQAQLIGSSVIGRSQWWWWPRLQPPTSSLLRPATDSDPDQDEVGDQHSHSHQPQLILTVDSLDTHLFPQSALQDLPFNTQHGVGSCKIFTHYIKGRLQKKMA